jgi:phosphoribosyl-AMP cyclohydrolase
VIASGGAGRIEDFAAALTDGRADAALAASLFHFGELTIAQVKDHLAANGVPVRRWREDSKWVEIMDDIKWDVNGLAAVIVQDEKTSQVLMLGYMNAEALDRTLETGLAHFWSRSRKKLWKKGETSGNVQRVRAIKYDCDGDAILLLVDPAGPACHTGEESCFYRELGADKRG